MSNLAVAPAGGSSALALTDDEILSVLESSLYPGAKLASIKMVLAWCRAAGKDPLKRPVHIVPMRVKRAGGGRDDYEWRDVVMPGIADYRIDAARTGQHAGNGEAVFGPTIAEKLGGVDVEYPEWCEFTVYRVVAGEARPFSSGKVRWRETYATARNDSAAPNAMWRKRPFGQLEKCAEALALRRAFPEVGANPTAEEMEGRTIDADGVDVIVPDADAGPHGVRMPRRAANATDVDPIPVAAPKAAQAPASQASGTFQTAADAVAKVAQVAERAKARQTAPAKAAEPPPQDAPQAPAEDAPAQAGGIGAGERAYLARRAGDRLDEILGEVGAGSLDSMTADQFAAARKIVLSW